MLTAFQSSQYQHHGVESFHRIWGGCLEIVSIRLLPFVAVWLLLWCVFASFLKEKRSRLSGVVGCGAGFVIGAVVMPEFWGQVGHFNIPPFLVPFLYPTLGLDRFVYSALGMSPALMLRELEALRAEMSLMPLLGIMMALWQGKKRKHCMILYATAVSFSFLTWSYDAFIWRMNG